MTEKTKGVLLIARNNGQIDYVKQAVFLAKRIKKYLNLPTSIVTDSEDYLRSTFDESVFDRIIGTSYSVDSTSEEQASSTFDASVFDSTADLNLKLYYDGALSHKVINFKNKIRSKCFKLSPYDETIVMDTDYIISNDKLNLCFKSDNNLLLFKEAQDIADVRNSREFKYITDTGIDFYWATVTFFRKTEEVKTFFNLVDYVQQEWEHFRNVYQINTPLFRNDFAFSIAVHIMNGFQSGDFAAPLPGKHLYTTDKDLLFKIKDDHMIFLVEKDRFLGEYTLVSTKGQNVHVMNKFSLERNIDV